MNPTSFINGLITYFNENKAICIISLLMFPVACALIYGSLKSFWQKRKYKNNTVRVYEMIKNADPNEPPLTTDFIANTLDIPRGDVISICVEHAEIMDAGKRQRSWKLSAIIQAPIE